MKVIIAIDSFKGCLTSKEANEAAAEGIRKAYPAIRKDVAQQNIRQSVISI